MRSEDLYDSLFDEASFTTLPQRLADLAGGRSVIAGWVFADGAQRFLATNGYFRDDHIEIYLRDYAADDPWTLAMLADFKPDILVDMRDHVSDEEFEASRLARFFRSIGDDTFRALSVSSATAYGMGSLAIHRGKSSREFDPAGLGQLASLAPHVARVLALRARYDAAALRESITRTMADHSPIAALAIDHARRLVEANAGAETLLAAGGALSIRDGRLKLTGSNASDIDRAIADALGASPAAITMALPRAGTMPLSLEIVPMSFSETSRGALLLVRDPVAMAPDTHQRLRQSFGLTAAQADVAVGIARGETIETLATLRGVSRETVRVQVRDVADKLGISRQAEIAATVRALGALSKNSAISMA
ncbi:MAG: helix-turn-helix transcriptional regulator [Alteraurantiacibacter sp.]